MMDPKMLHLSGTQKRPEYSALPPDIVTIT